MSAADNRSVTLPAEEAAYIDRLVEAGAYASAADVVRAGIRALQERDEGLEDWLRKEVAPVYDAMEADPSRGIPASDVFAAIRARHAAKV